MDHSFHSGTAYEIWENTTVAQSMGQRGESYVNADHSPPSYKQHKRGGITTTKQRSTIEGVRSVHSLSFKNCLRDLRGMDFIHFITACEIWENINSSLRGNAGSVTRNG